jgi:hypothetical protein
MSSMLSLRFSASAVFILARSTSCSGGGQLHVHAGAGFTQQHAAFVIDQGHGLRAVDLHERVQAFC